MYDNVIFNPPHLNENTIHKHVCSVCRGKGERNYLYMRGRRITLVRTPKPLTDAMESYPSLRPEAGASYTFSVLVHAVVRGNSGEHQIPEDHLPSWITARLNGFYLISLNYERLALTRIGKHETGCARPILFTGTVAVTDANAAVRTWQQGIGRLKAFGYGMLILNLPDNTQTKE